MPGIGRTACGGSPGRVKPSRRHLKTLTDYEKKTGWKYSITCTNIPDAGIAGVPGSHHPQYIDTVHREHAVVKTGGVRTAKAIGLRNLPSKPWQVNAGWVIAANISADLAAWTRLLGHCDDADLREADPDALRYRIWHLPGRVAHHARQRTLKISPSGHGKTRSSPAGSGCAPCLHPPDQTYDTRGGTARRGRTRCALGHTGHPRTTTRAIQTDTTPENGQQYNQ